MFWIPFGKFRSLFPFASSSLALLAFCAASLLWREKNTSSNHTQALKNTNKTPEIPMLVPIFSVFVRFFSVFSSPPPSQTARTPPAASTAPATARRHALGSGAIPGETFHQRGGKAQRALAKSKDFQKCTKPFLLSICLSSF